MSYLRNNKALLIIIAALLVVNVALLYGFLNREPKKEKPPRMNDEQRMQMTKNKLQGEVGFTDEQANKYVQLRKDHIANLRPIFDDLRTSKDSLFGLLYNPSVSDSMVTIYAAKVCEKQQAIDTRMVNYLRSLKALATDEQKPKMDSFLMNITRKMAGGPGGTGRNDRKEKEKK